MRKMTLSLVAAGLLASVAPVAQAALITFDSYTTGTLNAANSGSAWTVNAIAGVTNADITKYNISANGGLNDTKSITTPDQFSNNDATGVYKTAFNPTSGPITVSGYVHVVDPVNDGLGGTPLMGLGISANNTDSYNNAQNGSSGVNYVYARLVRTVNNALTYRMEIQNNTLGNNAANLTWTGAAFTSGGTASTISLTNDNWYFMSTTYTKSGNNLLVELKVLNALSDGTVGSSIFDHTGTVTNAVLAADTSVYGGFRAYNNGGMANLDNVTVVPEPTSLSLLGLGVAGLLLRRRKSV